MRAIENTAIGIVESPQQQIEAHPYIRDIWHRYEELTPGRLEIEQPSQRLLGLGDMLQHIRADHHVVIG